MKTAENNVQTIDSKDFEMTTCDQVEISLEKIRDVSKEDIDAELFTYVLAAPKGSGITAVSDLDDTWVQENLPIYNNMEEVREAIKKDLAKQLADSFENRKYAKCVDVLVSRLKGEFPDELISDQAETIKTRNTNALREQGISLKAYLEGNRMSEEEYEAKAREEAKHELSFNIALDKMAEIKKINLADEEIAEYLICDDEEAFLQELKESGKMEEARRAATRVKIMQGVLDTAKVTIEE